MFDQKLYREMFAQVTASGKVRQEVMMMAKLANQGASQSKRIRRPAILIAAVIAMMAMTLTAFASESVQSWVVGFFAHQSENELSQGQVEYIEENELTILDSQTNDGWTVELRSAIQDGTTAYIIFRVIGPEDIDLTAQTDEAGNILGNFIFGNMAMSNQGGKLTDLLVWPKDVYIQSWGFQWMENDGLPNSRTFAITLEPDMEKSKINPFGDEAVYRFRMETIVWEWTDLEYRQELMSGKYAGQTNVMFTQDEIARMNRKNLLSDGVWEFSLCFGQGADDAGDPIELLSAPVETVTNVFRVTGAGIDDFVTEEATVTLTSVQMNHLTVRFCYASTQGIPDMYLCEGDEIKLPYVVLMDGTMLRLLPRGNAGNGSVTFAAEQPIVFEDVNYILLADGTIIDMQE